MPSETPTVKKRPTAAMLGYFQYKYDLRVQNYAYMLADHGYDVDVFGLGDANYTSACPNGDTVQVYALQDRNRQEKGKFDFLSNILRFFMKASVAVTARHSERRYDVIHVHNVPDFLVFTALLPKLRGAKVILDIHDILPEFYARKFEMSPDSFVVSLLRMVERLSCRFADHVIIANDVWRDLVIRRAVPAHKCTSIINYPDSRVFKPRQRPEGAPNGRFNIFYHGSYTEHHGLDIALQAMALLKNRIDNFRFILYGKGPYETVMKGMIDDLDLSEWVDMRPAVPLDEIPRVLQEADLGIVPKKDGVFVGDALSTKLFQYTAMGIPSVVSRTVAEKRYFDEDEVMFFEAGNPEDLARCIAEMVRNKDVRELFARKALEKSAGYTLEVSSGRYMRIIEGLRDQ